MIFEKLIKILAFLVVLMVIYYRDHYYLVIVGGILFVSYKFNLHKKTYNLINKLTGRTNNVIENKNKRNKFLKKMFKNSGGEI